MAGCNTVGVVGSLTTALRIAAILPGFEVWRLTKGAVRWPERVVEMRHIASRNVIAVTGQAEWGTLRHMLELSFAESVILALAQSKVDPAIHFLREQSRRRWIAIGYRRQETAEAVRQEFTHAQPFSANRVFDELLFWLPRLGRRIIASPSP